ncbi:MAG: cysteine desulfurase CsdA [Marinilabiliales bacterium]|nr:MAG: cysteine desulfurase CsdA [Marinilabiliales bacterium]
MGFNIDKIRADFPILKRKVYGKQLVYFDNGATTHKPQQVIDSIVDYYSNFNSNVHRGVHKLSVEATTAFEDSRKYVAHFINAEDDREIVFTRGATESINLVANSFLSLINKGDEVLITSIEHHSNLVPWQQLCEKKNAKLKVVPVSDDGNLDMEFLDNMLSEKVKIFALSHISNVLGTINPIKEIIAKAHKFGIPVLIDGAQAIAHLKVDVQDLDCEFYCFSAHKAYGPMGFGVLYGKKEWLTRLQPYQYGGEMISSVSLDKTTFNEIPYKFEAGTPNVSGALATVAALKYIKNIGIDNIAKYEDDLLEYATEKLLEIDKMRIIGTSSEKTAVISFLVGDIHPYDIGTLLDQMGVAVRTGNHCAQPLIDNYCIPGTIRASFAVYNSKEEVDYFIEALKKSLAMLA